MTLPHHTGLRRMLLAGLAFAALALPAQAQDANPLPPAVLTDEAVSAVMARAVDEVIRPGYRDLHASATALTAAVSTFCATPSAESKTAAHAAFDDVVAKWSFIEIVRDGPVLEHNRFERILFYPDRKNTGLKQVQALLAKADEKDADPAALPGKSVAVQGLGALEFVLYGTGSETLDETKDSFRCRYGAAVAENIATTAGALSADWERAAGVQNDWKHPGPDNPVFRDSKEAITALLGILVHGAETVRDQRIEAFYKGEDASPKPKSAVYWRSGNTWNSIHGNFEGLRALFTKSGMEGLLDPGAASIAGNVEFVIRSLERVVPKIDPDIENAVHDPAERKKMDFLIVNARDLVLRLSNEYGGAIGLGAGFSFSDGD
ncbi:putative lipoprotein [Mycoplana sp. BE70]|uniref:imelysin family protein n=1 Tax=Mycoplana sp. BE70 TaxID=2817775 RepID=UPI00286367CB|nr:imelysin family protein [Mycoplana sp. BE70]MDR6755087.1 putative lipoprotein [Mycoplana sp. BE70]